MSLNLTTRGYHSYNHPTIVEPLGNFTNSKNPADVLITLLQDHYHEYFDEIEKVLLWSANTPRKPHDVIPSMYSTISSTEIEQRGIPHYKTTLEKSDVKIQYYTTNAAILYKVQQVIKQIIVSNNKVSDTSQIKNTGIKWMELQRFDYDVIYLGKEHVVYNLVATVNVVYQESYL